MNCLRGFQIHLKTPFETWVNIQIFESDTFLEDTQEVDVVSGENKTDTKTIVADREPCVNSPAG